MSPATTKIENHVIIKAYKKFFHKKIVAVRYCRKSSDLVLHIRYLKVQRTIHAAWNIKIFDQEYFIIQEFIKMTRQGWKAEQSFVFLIFLPSLLWEFFPLGGVCVHSQILFTGEHFSLSRMLQQIVTPLPRR